jgi:hypothetical protein
VGCGKVKPAVIAGMNGGGTGREGFKDCSLRADSILAAAAPKRRFIINTASHPRRWNLHSDRREYLKSYKVCLLFKNGKHFWKRGLPDLRTSQVEGGCFLPSPDAVALTRNGGSAVRDTILVSRPLLCRTPVSLSTRGSRKPMRGWQRKGEERTNETRTGHICSRARVKQLRGRTRL